MGVDSSDWMQGLRPGCMICGCMRVCIINLDLCKRRSKRKLSSKYQPGQNSPH